MKESEAQQPAQPTCLVSGLRSKRKTSWFSPPVDLPSHFHAILGQQKAISISGYNTEDVPDAAKGWNSQVNYLNPSLRSLIGLPKATTSVILP